MESANKRGRKKKLIDTTFSKKLTTLLDEAKIKNGIIQNDVAKAVGVSRQALGKWASGETVPDILDLVKLSKYFGVSANYLIDLSDVRSLDVNIQSACEFTGLSETAIYEILLHTKAVGIINDEEKPMSAYNEQFKHILDILLSSKYFWSICEKISLFSTHADEPDFTIESIQNNKELLSNPEKMLEMYQNKADSDRTCKYLRFEIQEDMSRICDLFSGRRPMLDMLEQQEILKIIHSRFVEKRNEREKL